MHLMHFSVNAHSSVQGSSKDNNEQGKDEPAARRATTAAPINNGPAQSTTTTSREESHSPGMGSMSYSNHQAQPRPLPTTAPQSVHELAPLHHNNQRQHHRHYSQHRYSNDRLGGALIDRLPELQPATSAMDPNRLPFSEFLRDVVHENSAETTRSGLVQGLTLLDYCDQGNLDLNEDDLGLLDYWNVDGHHSLSQGIRLAPGGHIRDGSTDMAQVRQDLVKMWTNSTWTPANNGKSRNSGTAASPASTPDMRDRIDRITPERLEPSARDRVLAMVLSTCRPGSSAMRVASLFPSVEVMDVLVQNFLLSMANQASQWIHFPTFRLDEQSTEWVAMAAAAGAAQSSMSTLRKFGFILQDAARATLPTQFEDNIPTARDIGLVQALLLAQEIGLWSGNRRKMELAQSQLTVPVTLLRYRNKFLRSSYPHVAVDPSDDGAELEAKWRLWVERERWKRLVFHCLLRDAQCSMATLTNQAISYAELTLPLPEPKELWMAGSALEWKNEYLQRHADRGRPLPSMGDLFFDIHQLSGNTLRLDVQSSVSIYLHGFWALILEYRRLSAIHKTRSNNGNAGGNQNLLLGSRHQELLKDLQSFQLLAQEWPDVTFEEHIVLNFLIMSLHVSLDDLQLFAGKEGEDQARRTYPVLQQWSSSSEARSAVSCASQIIRYAKAVAPGQLKDFCAVAVQQAALALWAYGVINKANKGPSTLPRPYQSSDPVYLDGTDTMPIQRFVGFGQGRPVIRGPMNGENTSESGLDDPRACMAIIQELLRSNVNDGCESLPPMVENLCTLVKQLGDAAWAVGLGSV
ncbi:Early growth response protein-like protein [Emericellopsis cladophorae]|uniref:Early growth response protein-like protein n=1 Tax=Emericellopsis cladophorae TaxID=2686198 RepID=A0A9P9Y9P6_9HYPO|nr:Early growth response protein-like protein [Emericellopsis cladophorae]KAI6785708.1 Early growth response protein-like protein [Emericellopsis cladophorae]